MRSHSSGHGSSTPSSGSAPRAVRVAALLAAGAAVLVYHGALAYFFGQDDFLGLARARGLAPALSGPWRWLSGQGYFMLMRPVAGTDALPYHAVSVVAHAASAACLARLLARRFSAPASLIGALAFAAHPTLYTAVYSVSGIGEILSLLFSLASVWMATRPGRSCGWALPLFALALLSKESVLLLPLALLVPGGWLDLAPSALAAGDASAGRARSPGLNAALGALAFAWALWLFESDVFAVRSGIGSAAPYAVSLGAHVLANAATYLSWTAGMLLVTTRSFQDAVEPTAWPLAIAVALAWLAGLAWKPLRDRGWLAGGVTFVALLLPVLGLRHHTYHYYLYAPMIGASWCVAALVDALTRERGAAAPRAGIRRARRGSAADGRDAGARGGRRAAGLAAAGVGGIGALLVLNGALLVHKIEIYPFTDPRLRADPVVDRARIAWRVYQGLSDAALPPGTPLVFWSPSSIRHEHEAHPGYDVPDTETYWETNVRTALLDGLAIRVLLPQLGEVRFTHSYRLEPAPTRYALYDPDGGLKVVTSARVDSLMAARAAHSGSR